MTAIEIARELNVHINTIYNKCRSGDIEAVRRGKYWSIDPRVIEDIRGDKTLGHIKRLMRRLQLKYLYKLELFLEDLITERMKA